MFDLQNNNLDEDEPWSGILPATDFAVQIIYYTTLQATPGQLFFGRDMMINTPFMVEWVYISLRKQIIIDINNQIGKMQTAHLENT